MLLEIKKKERKKLTLTKKILSNKKKLETFKGAWSEGGGDFECKSSFYFSGIRV